MIDELRIRKKDLKTILEQMDYADDNDTVSVVIEKKKGTLFYEISE